MSSEQHVADLERERAAFFEALAGVAPESMTTPGLVGAWSARELIAHLGYWAGHATEAIHAVEQEREDEHGLGGQSVDEINETVARVAREADLDTVRRREAASVEALIERMRALDPELLGVRLPSGETLADAIEEDGAGHYREHAAELRSLLAERPRG